MGAMGDESTIKIRKPQELTELRCRRRCWKVFDDVDRLRQCSDPSTIYVVSKKTYFLDTELTFCRIDDESVILQPRKQLSKMVGVFFRCATEHQDVIDVSECECQAAKNLINKTLEGLRGVSKSKRHSQELEQTKWCDVRSLGNVCRFDEDLVVGFNQIHFAENSGPFYHSAEVLNIWDQVAIWHCTLI